MMNGRVGQIARRVLALLVAALLVAGLVPALPEAPYALAEPVEETVDLGEKSQPSEDGPEEFGLSVPYSDRRQAGDTLPESASVASYLLTVP